MEQDSIKYVSPRVQQSYETVVIHTLNAFAIDLMGIPNEDELFWYVAQNVVGRMNFVDCVIYAANADQTMLIQVAALGEKNPHGRSIDNPLKIPFGQGITGRVAQYQKAIIVDDLLSEATYIPDTKPARSEICVPMVFNGRLVGVIDSEHPDPNMFGAAELEILTTVAAMTSAKLQLLEEAARSKQRYHDLEDSHARLKRAAQNRKVLEARLHEARKMEAIGQLAGGIAHDFNNLLTVISGNLEFLDLLGDQMDANALDCLADAQAAAQRAAGLVHNMLTFSQKAQLAPEWVNLNTLIHMTHAFSHRAIDKNIHVEMYPADDLQMVFVDKNMTERVILNLIFNACDAMPDGGHMSISTQNIVISARQAQKISMDTKPGKYVRMEVCDDGFGIQEDDMPRIFDPFFTTKGIAAGTGLGLSTVAGFMKQSGGAVTAFSQPGQGGKIPALFPCYCVG